MIKRKKRKVPMIREEIQIVRRRLEDYASYKRLADEADRKAIHMQELIHEAGSPHSPVWDKAAPVQNHCELSSILNQLISEQTGYDRDATEYRTRMKCIERFIGNVATDQAQQIMARHYLDGACFEELEDEMGISPSGLRMMIYRELEKLPFSLAAEII